MRAYLLLALAVLSWAGNWVVGRALRFDAPPVAITFWRWTIALAVLLPFTFEYLRTRWVFVLRSWKIVCLLALFSTILHHIPSYLGLRYTTATNGALLYATSPIFILMFSALFVRERLTMRGLVGSVVALAGVVVVVTRADWNALRALTLNIGDFLVLGATASWAAYTVAFRKLPVELERLPFLTLLALVSVIMTAPLYALEIASGRTIDASAGSFLGIAYIGVFATVVGYIFWNSGVDRVGSARAGPFMYLMLVFTPLLSIALLGEALHFYHLAGTALIVGGIAVATVRRASVRSE